MYINKYFLSFFTDYPRDVGEEASYNDGATPLIVACRLNYEKIVLLLLKQGANVNAVKLNGATAMYIAAQEGHINIVNLLHQYGADVHLVSLYTLPPLYAASQNGHIECVRFLLETCRADPNATDDKGWSPLNIAAQEGHNDIISLLLQHGANPFQLVHAKWNSIGIAIRRQRTEAAKAMIDFVIEKRQITPSELFGFSMDVNEGFGLAHVAASVENVDIMMYFIDTLGFNVNTTLMKEGYTVLHVAVLSCKFKMVRFLVSRGARPDIPNQRGATVTYVAQNTKIGSWIQASKRKTPLQLAVEVEPLVGPTPAYIRKLLKMGYDPSSRFYILDNNNMSDEELRTLSIQERKAKAQVYNITKLATVLKCSDDTQTVLQTAMKPWDGRHIDLFPDKFNKAAHAVFDNLTILPVEIRMHVISFMNRRHYM